MSGYIVDLQDRAIASAKVTALGLQSVISTGTGQFKIEVAATRAGTPVTIRVAAAGWRTISWTGLIPRDSISNPIKITLTRLRPGPERNDSENMAAGKPPVAAPKGPSLPFDITHALVELSSLEHNNGLQCGPARCLYLDVYIDGAPIFQKASDPNQNTTTMVRIALGHHRVGASIGSRVANLDPMGTCESNFELRHSTNLDITIQPKIAPGPSVEPGVPRRLIWTALCAVYAY